MKDMQAFLNAVQQGQFDERLRQLYVYHGSQQELEQARQRVCSVLEGFGREFPDVDCTGAALFSGPGRTEIGGNHTDHQHGCVLCASVNMDVLACVVPNETSQVRLVSEGYPALVIDLEDLEIHPEEKNTSASLIRGVAHGVVQEGFAVKGFCAYVSSTVLSGSGLSSSAAFETMLGNVFNQFCCKGALSAVKLAQIGQYAENKYFGKPCGLMDQAASSVGGVVAIDFNDSAHPVIETVQCNLEAHGYQMCIVDTQSYHVDLTDDYAGITQEMGGVAAYFGKAVLRDVEEAEFRRAIPALRHKLGDRAVLRAMHFFAENKRAQQQAKALHDGDMERFLELVRQSGQSSATLLQNTWSVATPQEQAIPLALALAEQVLQGAGAARVHGGGFAGTIQVFVPQSKLEQLVQTIEAVLGEGSCHLVSLRGEGGCLVFSSEQE